MNVKKYAAIDIGSNAMRLLINNVIEIDGEKHYKKVDIIRVPIRLGSEAFIKKEISEPTINKFLSAMRAYANLMNAHGIEKYRACATSALRDAKNGNDIIDLVQKETGINIEIISGKEEAEIIYSTHKEKLLNDHGSFLFVDVGGGSVEITLFENGTTKDSKSFDIGTLRILNKIIDDRIWEEVKNWVETITSNKKVYLIGSGGNINKVFKLSRKPKSEALSLDYLERYLEGLKNYSFEERVIKLDLNIDRADVIIPALIIFTSIMNWSKATQIYVPKIGLADGLIKMMD
ncbi:MAG: exopolyphosphatase/guanosine-5'-triphosphate,3'-diphosphate pyrophosphatase [Planctomycetota bacterium]|jgi:exopolyphosphatase/guanosine-5'-triphosphate,3'-diphosphate pyrophosphatase